MPSMTKRVNVQTRVAVRNTNPPIYGSYSNIVMTTGDILKCLIKKATIDEILPDGSTVRLNFKNYYTDNGAGLDAKAKEQTIVPKQPKPAIEFNKEENITKTETPEENVVKLVVDDKIDISDEVTVDVTAEEVTTDGEVADVTENVETVDVVADAEEAKEVTTDVTAEDIVVENDISLGAENDVEAVDVVSETVVTESNVEAITEEKTPEKEVAAEEAPKKTTTTAKKKNTSTSKKK